MQVDSLFLLRGNQPVVKDVSFSIDAGEIVGLIGPNGAGKSSTIGGILGFDPIHKGFIQVQNFTASNKSSLPADAKSLIAYIPEQPMYYSDLTLMEHFEWKQRLWRTYRRDTASEKLPTLIEEFTLGPHLQKFPHQCSKGTLQKLMVVSALMFPFDVLVIDEPFIGLDILAIRQLKLHIEAARQEGAAVLISTHVLDAAEKMCSKFVMLYEGSVFAKGTLQELMTLAESDDADLENLFVTLVSNRQLNADEKEMESL
ncbi:ABC transporter ATP-binding protein [Alicyclobacillus sp. SO9]|uniref:ABC transporter ATP-binding protein n=1 Tax=Alicyclobacillus sp. SO9 TaxID=2665646 RepID=UPI001E29A433|nr:ABC transporter ATP-binding protein [Alicyclobacillus sp. SO9]